MDSGYASEKTARYLRLLLVVLSIVTIVCLLLLLLAVHSFYSSGRLVVTTPDDDSIVTISANNTVANIIGNGKSVGVRLKPGSYLVGVARQGRISSRAITVQEHETTNISLSSTSTPLIRTSADINFTGTAALIRNGLTQSQIGALQNEIFRFNHATKLALIKSGSVTTPPLDPNSTSTNFSLNFTLQLDDTSYMATVSWNDLDNANLVLADSSGTVVFDAGAGHD